MLGTVTRGLTTGAVLSKSYNVGANSRFTIWVDEEQFSGSRALASASVSMRVRSTNAVPIIVERAMWWPQPNWYEAHNAPGTTVTGTRWALAGGEVGGPTGRQTFVLVANTSTFAGQARVSVYYEDGTSASSTIRRGSGRAPSGPFTSMGSARRSLPCRPPRRLP